MSFTRLGLSAIRSARLVAPAHALRRTAPHVRLMAVQAAEYTEAAATKKLYVGNLSFQATNDDLRELFSRYGSVEDAFIPTDRETGRSRGFGFVVLDADAALNAAQDLNESDFMGRTIRVNEALAVGDRPQGGRGGRGGFRGGRGGGRGRRFNNDYE